MTYRLSWLEHWSTKRDSADPRVITRFTEESDGWYEHEHFYYFMADNDEQAKTKAREYVEKSNNTIEVFSLFNRETKQVILTEEEQ